MTPSPTAGTPVPASRRPESAVRAAWRLVLTHPREVILPPLAVQLPLAVILSAISVAAFFTVLRNDAVVLPGEIIDDGSTGARFLIAATVAAQVLFGQVSHAAATVAIAGVARGKPLSVSECLDPAFSRMGVLVAYTVIFGVVVFGLAISVFLIPVAIYVFLRLGVAFEACVLEGVGPVAAMRRGWALMAGHLLRYSWGLIVVVATLLGPLVVVSLLNLTVTGSRDQQVVIEGAVSAVTAVLSVPLLSIASAYTTLMYLQLSGARNV
jgi:hypothetical protein